MTARNRNRETLGAYAQSRGELLRELQKEQEREVVRQRQADAAKTARLRALRLAKEAADAESAALPLGATGVGDVDAVPPVA